MPAEKNEINDESLSNLLLKHVDSVTVPAGSKLNDEKILKILLDYITLRIDIVNTSKDEENTIEIIENSDSNSNVSFPEWFKKNKSQGAIVISSSLSLDLKIKMLTSGQFKIILRSNDIRDKNKERFPVYLDVIQFKVNGISILSNHNPISFSSLKKFSKNVNKNEIVDVHLEWLPFNKYCEYKNPTKPLLNKIDKLTEKIEFFESNNEGFLNSFELKQYSDELSNLKKEFEDYKEDTKRYLDSYHFLLEDLYVNHEQTQRGYINQLHNVYNELLAFIDNVCIKHGLQWWLDYGNLLGAVRHGGFIPWDDDVDIGMMRTDYIKFYDILSEEIKENNLEDIVSLHFRQRKVNYKKANSFLQIFFYSDIPESKRLLANIDVFPYDYINDYRSSRKLNETYYNTRLNYYNNLINQKDEDECLKIMYDELNLNFNETDLIIPGVEGACGPNNLYPLSVYKTEKIFPLKRIQFSDRMFPSPNNTHYYLKRIYGDYLSLPDVVRSHKRSKKFKYVQNRQELYSNLFKTIHDVNEKF